MKNLMKLSVAIMMCLSIATIATIATAGEVKTWTIDELNKSEKLVQYGKHFRDRVVCGFGSTEGVIKNVIEQAANENVENIIVPYSKTSYEQKWTIWNNYYVAETFGINFFEPTQENIEKLLNQNTPYHAEIISDYYIGYRSALKHAKNNPNKKEIAKVILARINDITSIKVDTNDDWDVISVLFINAYADIMQKEAEPALIDLQKNYSFKSGKNEARKQLVKLGVSTYVNGPEATQENIDKMFSLNSLKLLRNEPEALNDYVLILKNAKNSPNEKKVAEVLIPLIKDDKSKAISTKIRVIFINGYADIMQKGAAPELTKLLKFHTDESARIAAGKQLIKIGEAATVEEAITKNEKSSTVKTALTKALME